MLLGCAFAVFVYVCECVFVKIFYAFSVVCMIPIYSHDFALAVVELLLLLTADVLLFELALSNPVINVSMINLIVSL